jgi:hypothetical protein
MNKSEREEAIEAFHYGKDNNRLTGNEVADMNLNGLIKTEPAPPPAPRATPTMSDIKDAVQIPPGTKFPNDRVWTPQAQIDFVQGRAPSA